MATEIKNPNGDLQFLTNHISHRVIDESARVIPDQDYSGIDMYIPFYSEKGLTNKLKHYSGSSALNDFINDHGEPNVKKYGLPYSAAVMHATAGGSIIAHPLKAKNATHGAFVLNMKVRLKKTSGNDKGKLLGYALDIDETKFTKVMDENGAVKWVYNGFVKKDGNKIPEVAANSTGTGFNDHGFTEVEQIDKIASQYIDVDTYEKNFAPFLKAWATAKSGDADDKIAAEKLLNAKYRTVVKTTHETSDFGQQMEDFIKLYKPIYVNPLEITFDSVNIHNEIIKIKTALGKVNYQLTKKPQDKDLLSKKNYYNIINNSTILGVSSWETLSTLVRNGIGRDIEKGELSIEEGLKKLTNNQLPSEEMVVVTPIIWGYHESKGMYANRYQIVFENSETTIEDRPTMISYIKDIKLNEILRGSRKVISLSNDFAYGVPLLLDSAYINNTFDEGFKFATADVKTFDKLGALIQKILKLTLNSNGEEVVELAGVKPKFYKSTEHGKEYDSYGAIIDKSIASFNDVIALFDEAEDSSFHRLSKFDLTRIAQLVPFEYNGGILEANFNSGAEGELKYMKEFSYKFNLLDYIKEHLDEHGKVVTNDIDLKLLLESAGIAEFDKPTKDEDSILTLPMSLIPDVKPEYIVEQLFINAFNGKANPEIRSIWSNSSKYVVDLNYTKDIKTAMVAFSQLKDSNLVLFNVEAGARTLPEIVGSKRNFDFEGRNFVWYTGQFPWVDPYSNRSVYVPTTFYLIPLLVSFFSNGFDLPFAGIDRTLMTQLDHNTGYGFGDMTEESNDTLLKAGINVFSSYRGGTMYLDSQKCNFNLSKETPLQDFHNNAILNEIIKVTYKTLQRLEHIIVDAGTAEYVGKIINDTLTPFRSKVADLQYVPSFKDDIDYNIGRLTHSIKIMFKRGLRYHQIDLIAIPIKLK